MPKPSPALASHPAPTVSFVLATYNRGPVLLECLQKTLSCGLPSAQFSITIIDNASTDGTPELLERFIQQTGVRNIRLQRLVKNCGPVAKNIGLHKNPADILVILDDDAYPLPSAIPRMLRHFAEDPKLGAAVFDVMLPDGSKEASAYPDVFIGAGTAFRGSALHETAERIGLGRPGHGLLPADFFMQAEEYDLSFRLLAAGWSIQRFWDMPLMHLKAPAARIGQRTTRFDVRNNLWLLARYLPEPLCFDFAADWLARYWRMAARRDAQPSGEGHKAAFIRGAAEGLAQWKRQRDTQQSLLSTKIVERIFKFEEIQNRLRRAKERFGWQRVAFGDWGKNLLAYWLAARALDLEIVAIIDNQLAATHAERPVDYRGIPIMDEATFRDSFQTNAKADGIIVTAMSPVHAQRRAAALTRIFGGRAPSLPVVDLFAKDLFGEFSRS